MDLADMIGMGGPALRMLLLMSCVPICPSKLSTGERDCDLVTPKELINE